MSVPNLLEIKNYLNGLQADICQALTSVEKTKTFQQDQWQRVEGGGGRTHVLSEGTVIEKSGVNFSHVWGEKMPAPATKHRPELIGCSFEALGLSTIIHPNNPYAPTAHLNVRFFIAQKPTGEATWWFGGGFDLTPYYGFVEDCVHWHQTARKACDPFGLQFYPAYKKWADDYFYLKHRQEPRGIGGIFFDDLTAADNHLVKPLALKDFASCFAFARSIGDHFIPAYLPILTKRSPHLYTEQQRDFQCYRRGRYVEFNLIQDRGTLFGLHSAGRTESILISLPPEVRWRYDWHPTPGSEEASLYENFLMPRDWADF